MRIRRNFFSWYSSCSLPSASSHRNATRAFVWMCVSMSLKEEAVENVLSRRTSVNVCVDVCGNFTVREKCYFWELHIDVCVQRPEIQVYRWHRVQCATIKCDQIKMWNGIISICLCLLLVCSNCSFSYSTKFSEMPQICCNFRTISGICSVCVVLHFSALLTALHDCVRNSLENWPVPWWVIAGSRV